MEPQRKEVPKSPKFREFPSNLGNRNMDADATITNNMSKGQRTDLGWVRPFLDQVLDRWTDCNDLMETEQGQTGGVGADIRDPGRFDKTMGGEEEVGVGEG